MQRCHVFTSFALLFLNIHVLSIFFFKCTALKKTKTNCHFSLECCLLWLQVLWCTYQHCKKKKNLTGVVSIICQSDTGVECVPSLHNHFRITSERLNIGSDWTAPAALACRSGLNNRRHLRMILLSEALFIILWPHLGLIMLAVAFCFVPVDYLKGLTESTFVS